MTNFIVLFKENSTHLYLSIYFLYGITSFKKKSITNLNGINQQVNRNVHTI